MGKKCGWLYELGSLRDLAVHVAPKFYGVVEAVQCATSPLEVNVTHCFPIRIIDHLAFIPGYRNA